MNARSIKRIVLWALAGLTVLFVSGAIFPIRSTCTGTSGRVAKAMVEAKQVGIAATLYCDDHQGRLPNTLDELAPDYLPDKALLPQIYLTTPQALLADLKPESIILFRVVPGKRQQDARVVVVHADVSVEQLKPKAKL